MTMDGLNVGIAGVNICQAEKDLTKIWLVIASPKWINIIF